MKYVVTPCLLAIVVFAMISCTEPAPTDFDAASDSSSGVLAKKGGKPSGGEPTPPGLIYASVGSDRVEMDGDGNVLRPLDPGVRGHATSGTFDEKRWFVYTEVVAGVYPDSSGRSGLFVVNESGDVYTLLNDPFFDLWEPRWSPDSMNVQIAFQGRRFSSSTAAADEGGIYVADVSFATNPTMATPSLRIAGDMTEDAARCTTDGICNAFSDVGSFDWSPDGSKLAYTVREWPLGEPSPHSLYIEGTSGVVAARVSSPRWSSQDKLLFRRSSFERSTVVTRMFTTNLDGSNETEVLKLQDKSGMRWTSKRIKGHEWSPSGDHFVYGWRESSSLYGWSEAELVRRNADGSGAKVLASSSWTTTQGWR